MAVGSLEIMCSGLLGQGVDGNRAMFSGLPGFLGRKLTVIVAAGPKETMFSRLSKPLGRKLRVTVVWLWALLYWKQCFQGFLGRELTIIVVWLWAL